MTDSTLQLAFAGTPALAATILQTLIDNTAHDIVVVYTQPDRPAGRGRKLHESEVKRIATARQLDIRQPASAADIDPAGQLSNVDVLIVAAYGMILPAALLTQPRLGCINVHTSLLPRWRGAAPIQRSIQAGDTETGISIMQMDTGLDTGDILLQQSCPIHSDDTAGTLHDRLAILGGKCLLETLNRILTGDIHPLKQDDRQATYARKLSKVEALIDWSKPAIEVQRMIRAFNPAPVAHTELNGIKMRIWDADILDKAHESQAPGSVIACRPDGIIVTTGTQLLCIRRLQLPGKKASTTQDFLNGHPDFI
ncbi:MAG: methionyl-tRNA formyltransferase [Gammaproteobacteria bacterium]|nr:methionyl-tRNA formyltransferase [Gammaproteobacteria bacterium]